jgi:hypothetical protein
MRQKMRGMRLLLVGVLACGWLMAAVEPAMARPGHRGFGHRHFHSRSFLGFGFYGFPFYGFPYSPYYYPSYYSPYAPGEHRHFPAFRLPGFFHYPGAIGKGEAGHEAFQPGAPGVGTSDQMTGGHRSAVP